MTTIPTIPTIHIDEGRQANLQRIIDCIHAVKQAYAAGPDLTRHILAGDDGALQTGLAWRAECGWLQDQLNDISGAGGGRDELEFHIVENLLGMTDTVDAVAAVTGEWMLEEVAERYGDEVAARFEPKILKREIGSYERALSRLAEATAGREMVEHEVEYKKLLDKEIFDAQLRLVQLGHLVLKPEYDRSAGGES